MIRLLEYSRPASNKKIMQNFWNEEIVLTLLSARKYATTEQKII